MDNIVVRDATPDDCATLFNMVVEITLYQKKHLNDIKITADALKKDGFQNDSWFNCLVATRSNEIIGYTLFFRTYSIRYGRAIKIEDLYVRAGYRKLGVGKRLMQEVSIKL